MSRIHCAKCDFIIDDCICDVIERVDNQTHIVVLQHKSEVKNAKNTVRLAKLLYTNITVIIGDIPSDFKQLEQLPKASTVLLYPCDEAISLERADSEPLTHLVVLDGTWKKANKLFFTVPILAQFKAVSFGELPENKYHIRKAKRADSLSSLEAMAYALQIVDRQSMSNAYKALDKMMGNQFKYMPAEVRARYKK